MWSLSDIEAVLFDLDGTLVDTAQDFVHVLNHQRALHQLKPLEQQLIRDTVSDGARALTKLAFGGEPGEEKFEEKRLELLDLYFEKVGEEAALFAGMEDVLSHLEAHQILWGIVTNKPRKFTVKLLDKINLDHRCAVTVCPDDVKKAKPDPESLIFAASKIQCSPTQTLYVGDHERDIIAGKAANMPTVAAKYGYIMCPEDAHSWQADQVIEHPSHLIQLIR